MGGNEQADLLDIMYEERYHALTVSSCPPVVARRLGGRVHQLSNQSALRA